MNEYDLIKKYVPLKEQEKAIQLLDNGYPVQYIIGNVDFYGYKINVNDSVLIPRFETELLVDKTINLIKEHFSSKQVSIADLGTGSGAIAIALQKSLNAFVKGFDISDDALKVAKDNAKENEANVEFIKHDINYIIPGKYDVIISNPPYLIKGSEIAKPVEYEPALALYASNEGLEYYYHILDYASKVLNNKYLIAFEIGLNQEDKIVNYAKEKLMYSRVWVEKDLTGVNRYVFIINE